MELVRHHASLVMRLPREAIDPNQPLSELGLDSLMAVELRTQLSRVLGTEVSLNPLRMRRSVAEIATYLRNPEAPSVFADSSKTKLSNLELDVPRVHLVPLQPNGDAVPLFFVPAGYGDLLAFQDIAHALGVNQPVYGLQPASAAKVKTIRQMSIYRLVSAYIAEIKKVQPNGPYRLSGYSAGAIIAIELARELMRQGDEVSLLVIFDPPSHVPFWLDWFYAINYRICLHTRLLNVIRSVPSRFIRKLFHTVLDEGLRTHTTVTTEHHAAPYPGRITHFRARLSQSSLVSLRPVGSFWRRIALGGIEVHWIPGTHYGMLRGSGAGVVVDELNDCLQRSERSVSSQRDPS
jgi:acyl carrier protein